MKCGYLLLTNMKHILDTKNKYKWNKYHSSHIFYSSVWLFNFKSSISCEPLTVQNVSYCLHSKLSNNNNEVCLHPNF